jgi:hypothetical protein
VCGVIWLAGSQRFLSETSKVGFHAAYRADGSESGQANAVVGAYLSDLGLSYAAIAFLTRSSPEAMTWLSSTDATRLGITYSLLKPPTPAPEPQPFQAPSVAPAPPPSQAPQRSAAEQQAIRLVLDYNAFWSQGGGNVEGLAQYYAPLVAFYGGNVTRDKVMDEKRKFSLRWLIRHYTVNQDSLFVQCDSYGVCSITGILSWDCTSFERGQRSIGTANFAWRVANGTIISENGSVLTSHADPLASSSVATTTAYEQGRNDRIAWESWFNSLSGDYRAGAFYWSGERSLPRPGSCASPKPEFTAGCVAAQGRLAASDARRKTEPDYRAGWNSL